jgi:hypothetical protein
MTRVARRTDGVARAVTAGKRAYATTSAMHDFRGTTAVTTRGMTGASGKMKAAGVIGVCRAVSGRPRTCINGRMRNSAGTVVVTASVVSKMARMVRKSYQVQRRESGT